MNVGELLNRLAPEGVRYLPVSELFDLRNGYTPPKSNASFWSGGEVPWFRMEDIRENGRILHDALQRIPLGAVKGGRPFPANSLLVATSATIGEHALISVPHLSNQRFTALSAKAEFAHELDMKFAYYYAFLLDDWCLNNTTTSSFASVDMKGFRRFRFPLPPLDVQREIVQILDNFTQLEAELEAELEARRRQYSHIRSRLLQAGEHAAEPLANLVNGVSSGRNKNRTASGEFPVFGSTGRIGATDTPAYSGNRLLVARVGANAGYVSHVSGQFDVSDNTLILEPNSRWDVRYAFHQLSHLNLNRLAVGGGQPLITGKKVKELRISLPPIEEQRRIASLLDQLADLVGNESFGLPAEIAARRKQYEYYRGRLLLFEELPA